MAERIHVRALVHEQLHRFHMAGDGREHQGSAAVIVPGVDVDSAFQESLYENERTRLRRRHQSSLAIRQTDLRIRPRIEQHHRTLNVMILHSGMKRVI